MELPGVFIFIPLLILWTVSISHTVDTADLTTPAVVKALKPDNHTSNGVRNSTTSSNSSIFPKLNVDSSMIQRALYVLIGITIIGVLYFLVRAVRLKKTTQRNKYGLLSNSDDNMEMAPLESDEDDTTVYEAKALRR
ncbi:protein FAM174C [Megalops cyprinoides]|uniref:protein FAM174C n=1 Tax=Megalops cyprinoides TaxID=118141 RepID=UPI0018653DF6|nr:protein FAM174C [Megalops cyprinoides]